MEIYKESGQSGKVYHVFDRKKKPEKAIEEAARYQKIGRAKMETVPVWIKGDTLYTEATRGAKKMLAAVRKAGA